jgi:hypothetical protein
LKRTSCFFTRGYLAYPLGYCNPEEVMEERGSGSITGSNTFDSPRCTLRGIARMHMIKKSRMIADEGTKLSAAGPFYSLAV